MGKDVGRSRSEEESYKQSGLLFDNIEVDDQSVNLINLCAAIYCGSACKRELG
jgi:hypothetical protein